MVWQEESYNSDLKIYFKLCGDSEQDELKEVEFANLLKNLPEYANRSFHGESIMSIIERKVPLVEIRKIESEPAHQYSPPELKLLERWSDLSVKLVSDDSIRIKINHERSQEYHYVKLGFDDKRRGLQTSNIRWKWIILLAKYDGCIRVGESEVLDFEKRAKTEKGISILRNDLKSIFELNENPIVGAKRSGVFEYTCAFTINDLRGQQG